MQSANNNVLELKPFYINFLAESVEHMLVFRNGAEYAMQNASYLSQRCADEKRSGNEGAIPLLDVANGSLIKGNLAKMVLTCDEKSWGVDWIAPSFHMKKIVMKALTSERSQIVLTAENGLIKVTATQYVDHSTSCGEQWQSKDWTYSFSPVFTAVCDEHHDRTHDSEHLLLNYLHHLIVNGQIKQENEAPGFLTIVSERIPCSSCTKNISDFLESHSWINLRLYYFHDTTDRGPQQFLDECKDQRISEIEKIALSSIIHVVSVNNNPHIRLTERVVEQQKMFGGAPNQIMSSVKTA
jgi:hypothetical protein